VTEGVRIHVRSVCPELVFTLDKIAISEWEDQVERKGFTALAMREQKIFMEFTMD
jgi:hypothetical protein